MPDTLRIALATPRNDPDIDARLATADRMLAEAAGEGAAIACFPETYIPGLRGQDFDVPPPDQARQQDALDAIRASCARHGIAAIVGMEWETALGLHNVAVVIGRDGTVEGLQAKNQVPPEEAPFYVPDGERRMFAIDGVPFGITICHEGWRYPESVRWAAMRGAKIVFHPQLTGSDRTGPVLERWGDPAAPYYEKAMILRAVENETWFASVNYAFRYPESASSIVAPNGSCLAHQPYGEEGVLVREIDLTLATGQYAQRYNPANYPWPDTVRS